MANKITETKNGVTSVLLDVSQTTATEADVAQGKIFTKQDGTQGTGTLVAGGDNPLTATDDSTMEALLVSENIGKVAQFNGTSSTYVDGVFYLIEGAVSLISFTIGDTSYQAVEGMTWAEWCNSEYSNNAFYVGGTAIFEGMEGDNSPYIVALGSNPVISTEAIVENTTYTITTTGTQD